MVQSATQRGRQTARRRERERVPTSDGDDGIQEKEECPVAEARL